MKNNFIIVYLFVLTSLLSGCDGKEGPDPYPFINRQSYIQRYYDLDSIEVSVCSGFLVNKATKTINPIHHGYDNESELPQNVLLLITCLMDPFYSIYGQLDLYYIDAAPNNSQVDKYWQLATQIGDRSYNSNYVWGFYGLFSAITDTLQSITITCDKNFDTQHPAGSDLSDLFSVYFEAPYLTIKNGYKSYIGSNTYKVEGEGNYFPYTVVGGKLQEMPFGQMPFIAHKLFCVLDSAPEQTDLYTFSVTIKNLRGILFKHSTISVKIIGKK